MLSHQQNTEIFSSTDTIEYYTKICPLCKGDGCLMTSETITRCEVCNGIGFLINYRQKCNYSV